jgi:hypothetical protein
MKRNELKTVHELTPKQRMFVEILVQEHGNITQHEAYKRAGYEAANENTAKSCASQLLGKTLSKRCLKLYRPVSVFTDPRSLKPRSSFSFPYHWPTVQQQLVKELVQPEAEEQELVLVSRPC